MTGAGLYYYGARYYDPLIERFISPDTIIPHPANPQSFNRYSYCLNNPLKFNDPTGNWPNWSKIGSAIKNAAQTVVNVVKENVDVIQTGLDVAGMIPVVGGAFDAVNGVIYAARGDALNASLSFAACVPVVGTAATGAKLIAKTVDKVHDVVKAADIAQNVKTINSVQNIEKATGPYSVYLNIDKTTRNVDYVGMTNNFDRRAAEQFRTSGRNIQRIEGIENLSQFDARAVEQVLINNYGLSRYGGTLTNRINSIAKSNQIFNSSVKRGMDILWNAGLYLK